MTDAQKFSSISQRLSQIFQLFNLRLSQLAPKAEPPCSTGDKRPLGKQSRFQLQRSEFSDGSVIFANRAEAVAPSSSPS